MTRQPAMAHTREVPDADTPRTEALGHASASGNASLAASPAPSVSPAAAERKPPQFAAENQLLLVRMGIASSLFTALRARDANTAAHSLRVTLSCASWALWLELSDEQRDILEVAALLHDMGKIGVPDAVLLKPAGLTPDEAAIMERHRRIGVEILRSSSASPELLEIVTYGPAWFDGGRTGFEKKGLDLPLGARILAIADAFDAMTSEQVYRRSLSKERAFAELYRCSGTQFDPQLVEDFAALHQQDLRKMHEQVARRWLTALNQDRAQALWRLNVEQGAAAQSGPENLFQRKLLDNMRDAVLFVDASQQIVQWNPGAERMTGIAEDAVFQKHFLPSMLELRDEEGFVINDDECPVLKAVQTGEQVLRRMTLRGRGQRDVSVDAHIVPVINGQGTVLGATMLLRDVSPELSLEARCHSLHEMATKDPLTQVANRAEFNRVHEMFVSAHLERRLPCSLVLCDIDHFKLVNDNYGHPAGDEVLKAFAKVLKSACRPGDLVARYGGEEFALLCADCDCSSAARRAEEIRRMLTQLPHQALGGRNVTASFGVTEIQQGDSTATMLARADRGLYDAKERGRNNVVQLGSGIRGDEESTKAGGAARSGQSDRLAEQNLITSVPLSVAIEKLRGFVADQDAEILSVEGGQVRLKVGDCGGFFRRTTDRNVPLLMDLHFEEETLSADAAKQNSNALRTRIHVSVSPQRTRDRRRADATARARQLMASFRAYLMATEDFSSPEPTVQRRGKGLMLPWLKRKK